MRERPLLEEHMDKYSGLCIESHILEIFKNSISQFIQAHKIPFFIDPVFYKFIKINSLEALEEKRWYIPLVDHYGLDPEIKDAVLLDETIFTETFIQKVVNKILNYQKCRVMDLSASSLLSLLGESCKLIPLFLIAPYILINNKRTLLINKELIASSINWAVKENIDLPLFAVIMLDKGLLFPQQVDKIIEHLSDLNDKPLKGYFIWVTDFKESEEDDNNLRAFKYLIEILRGQNKEVYNLYGGYFSLLLAKKGILDGVVSGIGLGEARDPFAEPGVVLPRYYSPVLKRMLSITMADALLAYDRSIFKCECPVCSNSNDIASLKTMDLTKHFIESRLQEYQNIQNFSLQDLKDELSRTVDLMKQKSTDPILKAIGINGKYEHLERWYKLI